MSYSDKVSNAESYLLYRPLLTNQQQKIADMILFDDYSLAEAAAELKITRSSVQQIIKRVVAKVDHYEKVLGIKLLLTELRQLAEKNNATEINNRIDEIIYGRKI